MIGIYFSGTGNSRYAVEVFCSDYDESTKAFSIEDDNIIEAVKNEEVLVLHILCNIVLCPKYCVIL